VCVCVCVWGGGDFRLIGLGLLQFTPASAKTNFYRPHGHMILTAESEESLRDKIVK